MCASGGSPHPPEAQHLEFVFLGSGGPRPQEYKEKICASGPVVTSCNEAPRKESTAPAARSLKAPQCRALAVLHQWRAPTTGGITVMAPCALQPHPACGCIRLLGRTAPGKAARAGAPSSVRPAPHRTRGASCGATQHEHTMVRVPLTVQGHRPTTMLQLAMGYHTA